MSRAEERPVWAGTERSQLNEVRNKKSLENCIRRVEETLGRLDILEELAQVCIELRELRADMSRLAAAVDKGAAQQEQSSQSLRTSREARDNETKAVRTEIKRRAEEKKGENHNAPDNRGVESEGFILSKELPRLSSAAGGIPARWELTNGTGAVANRPEEASDKRSSLKCHDIKTAKTPEVQPKLEPTNQLELQEVPQVGMEIVPSKPPLPPRFYEPPSRGCWKQPTGESSRGQKRPFRGQPDGFSEQQTTATGQVFHQPDKGPIMRVSDSNRTPTEFSRDLQSVSQRPSYGPLYGTSGHLSADSIHKLQSGSCVCNVCLSAQSSQMRCSVTNGLPHGNSINPATAPAPWPEQDYNAHPTCPTTQNPSIRYGPIYGLHCGPPSYINSAPYQVVSKMPSMFPQTSNNSMYPMSSDPRGRFPGYLATAPAQRLQPVSNIPPGHSQTQNLQITDPCPRDSYGTQGREMRSGESTATNSQRLSQNRVTLFHNTTTSDASIIMHSVAPSGSRKTLERRKREAQARERRLKSVAIRAIQVANAHVGLLKKEP
ncbi:uncharacterized protein FMAN_14175 [Fusarium mangiferae]|uniref:Uncharacterized protein n=1 Tax=Fusarium mangiferae TaxID=192010 RepID=A0A1L7UBR8_FUSMA|nr:uncharacterized protein FMAN_14175 [Fusarium mangiferae]CVL08174.1 uncharacterized protein FMAN_14175 [Fusarium mangiferae]